MLTRLTAPLVLTCLATSVAPTLAQSTEPRGELHPANVRFVWHSTRWIPIDVGDVPGHTLGVAEYKGLAILQSGEIATASEVSTFDHTLGAGETHGYVLFTFDDGASQVIPIEGLDAATQEEAGSFEGRYSYVRGSGRFKGIEGAGTFTGRYYDSVKAGFNDFAGSYRLPSR